MFDVLSLPQRLFAAAGLAALCTFGGYIWRWSGDDARQAAAHAESVKITRADFQRRNTRATAAARQTETEKEKIRVVYRTLQGKAEWLTATRVEYLHVCLPDDGLRLWNAGNAGEVQHGGLQQDGVDRTLPRETPAVP
jgi:hypothetical protein